MPWRTGFWWFPSLVFWGWEAMGRRGKERGGGEELVLVLTHYREVSWWPDFVRDGEDDALRHGELLEPVLLGITGMCAGGKGRGDLLQGQGVAESDARRKA